MNTSLYTVYIIITIVIIRMMGVNILLVFMMGQKGEIAVTCTFFHFYSDCVPYSDHFSQLKGLINNCFRT